MVNLLSFPGLGLEFYLNRVAVELFGRPIYWYGVIIAFGFLSGAMISARLASKFTLEEEHIYDYLFFAVPAALVGLRAYYVVFYLERYINTDGSLDWAAIFRISDGGMAIYGGIIAAVIVLVFFCKARKVEFFHLADVMSIGLILGQAIGRWGNFANVEAYGGLTSGPWRMCSESIASEMFQKGYATEAEVTAILEGTLGVHPTFFYESVWNFVGFGILLLLTGKRRTFAGKLFMTYCAWYGLGRFIIEGMRTDSLYFFGLEFMGYPLRSSQMLSLAIFVVGGVFLLLGEKGKLSFLKPLTLETVSADKQDVGNESEGQSPEAKEENAPEESKEASTEENEKK